ncbi:hypothetical protein [Parachryseolinea silvisoli]|jgi:hypothetical protein|uniref:hypothetical protein n=1 Tax=Parachryseolinea silvisoli TaxID=2873601 RepID=UPI002265F9C5|nr:hypothetical protein [Parachryseolinea silvisoli]MCD9019762.1 hypothetical protein [Parachryseolinea silvisoli]
MNFVKKALFVVVFMLIANRAIVYAQPTNPPGGDPDKVPITGIEYLLISGGLLGGYKLLKRKKAKEE